MIADATACHQCLMFTLTKEEVASHASAIALLRVTRFLPASSLEVHAMPLSMLERTLQQAHKMTVSPLDAHT